MIVSVSANRESLNVKTMVILWQGYNSKLKRLSLGFKQ